MEPLSPDESDAVPTIELPTEDTVDLLDVLGQAWDVLCSRYEITADRPAIEALFAGADLHAPDQAAETVVANMLSEIVECVGRFSPWYKRPTKAYGLIPIRDRETDRLGWALSPQAIRQQRGLLQPLAVAIRRNAGLIQAATLLSNLMNDGLPEERRVLARCQCCPPRFILVPRATLTDDQIICDSCRQPFRPASDETDPDAGDG